LLGFGDERRIEKLGFGFCGLVFFSFVFGTERGGNEEREAVRQ